VVAAGVGLVSGKPSACAGSAGLVSADAAGTASGFNGVPAVAAEAIGGGTV
jgi:hypothetical protein